MHVYFSMCVYFRKISHFRVLCSNVAANSVSMWVLQDILKSCIRICFTQLHRQGWQISAKSHVNTTIWKYCKSMDGYKCKHGFKSSNLSSHQIWTCRSCKHTKINEFKKHCFSFYYLIFFSIADILIFLNNFFLQKCLNMGIILPEIYI